MYSHACSLYYIVTWTCFYVIKSFGNYIGNERLGRFEILSVDNNNIKYYIGAPKGNIIYIADCIYARELQTRYHNSNLGTTFDETLMKSSPASQFRF